MLNIRFGKSFKKARKRLLRSGDFDDDSLRGVIEMLAEGRALPDKYHDHALQANWAGYRECHIQSDILLIYEVQDDEIVLAHIGTHAELFGR
jgi:mRNA interferase YafQ